MSAPEQEDTPTVDPPEEPAAGAVEDAVREPEVPHTPEQDVDVPEQDVDVPEQEPAALRIIAGNPTPEQTAALVAVLAAVGGTDDADAPAQRSLWSDHERAVRSRLSPGPGAWRASALPR